MDHLASTPVTTSALVGDISCSDLCHIFVWYQSNICVIFAWYLCAIFHPDGEFCLNLISPREHWWKWMIYMLHCNALIFVSFLSNLFIYFDIFVMYLCAEFDPDTAFDLNPLSQWVHLWVKYTAVYPALNAHCHIYVFICRIFVCCMLKSYLLISEIISFNCRNCIFQLQKSYLLIAEIVSFNCRNPILQLQKSYLSITEIIYFN